MATTLLKRGRATTLNIKLKPAVVDNAGVVTNPYTKDFSSNYSATLIIRRKAGNSYSGPLIDTLTSANSGTGANRITFPSLTGATTTENNVVVKWLTADADVLPNESTTVYGDLKILNTATNPDSVEHSTRLTFEIVPEII